MSNIHLLFSVSSLDDPIVDDSIASQFKDYEDAMQYYTALNAKAEIIISRKGKDFTSAELAVMTATGFISTRITKRI